MQRVSEAYKCEMQQPIVGEAYIKITFGTIDADAAATCAPWDNGHEEWSSLASPLHEVSVPSKTYATFEPGRMRLNGTQRIPPSPNESVITEGFVSSALSNASGVYTFIPSIKLAFSKLHTVAALTLTFDDVTGDFPSRLKIIAWRGDEVLLDKIYTPDAAEWQTEDMIERFDFLEILFLKSNLPYRRARLQQIMFGIGAVFTKAVAKASQKMECDPITRRLPIEEFGFSLVNFDTISSNTSEMYNPDNPKGIWKYIEQKSPIQVEYGQQLLMPQTWGDLYTQAWADAEQYTWGKLYEGGVIQWIKGGRFYLTAQPQVNGIHASFKAQSLLMFMNSDYYKGTYSPEGRSLYDLAVDVFADASLPLVFADDVPYRLWEGLKNTITQAPLPMLKSKECLQYIAHAACCVLFTDRDGYIHIEPSHGTLEDCFLSYRSMRSEPKVNKIATLKAVECTVHLISLEEKVSEMYKGTHTLNGETFIHITYSPSTEHSLSLSNGKIKNAIYYAAAADIILIGQGACELVITGRKLIVNTSTLVLNVTDADENGAVEGLNNPLITSIDTAADVSKWVRSYLLHRSTYEFETRGTPEVDAMDIIETESQFNPRFNARILKHELEYGGGFKGKILCKKLEV